MTANSKGGLIITSTAFAHEGNIPSKYTCQGEDVNPPLNIEGIPEHTKALALIMEDPDAPGGTFDHWIAWNIASEKKIQENRALGTGGKNSFGKTGYGGPCPPSGTHRYYFKIYALDTSLDLLAGSDKKALLQAMEGHIMASGELMGKYEKR